jgi:hypothetical protein
MVADMVLTLLLPEGSVGGFLGENLTEIDGRPALEAALKGPLSDPSVVPLVGKVIKRAAESLLKKGMEKFLNKKDADSGGSETPPQNAQPSQEEELLQKTFEKLFRKK